MATSALGCPVCTGTPSVVVAVAHQTLRTLIVEMLERDKARWLVRSVANNLDLAVIVAAEEPDLVILDAGDFVRSSRRPLQTYSPERAIVVNPEADVAYEDAARRGGAGAWLISDRLGEDLGGCMRTVLGCTHGVAGALIRPAFC